MGNSKDDVRADQVGDYEEVRLMKVQKTVARRDGTRKVLLDTRSSTGTINLKSIEHQSYHCLFRSLIIISSECNVCLSNHRQIDPNLDYRICCHGSQP